MGSRLKNIQARAAEHGRLRTGYTQGNRPMRSATFVVTSHSEEHVRKAAELWGGTAEQWTPLNSTIAQWRVITRASSIEALITPGDPLNQYNELWTGGGCQRRCDGETELMTRQSCLCARQFGEDWHQQKKGTVCSATSRLNVMLPDLTGMGMWRAETHSFYAAAEWGGMVDMVLKGTDGKGFVPVTLRIEPRQVVRAGKTVKFPVIVVELRGVTPRQALAGPLSTAMALDPAGTARAAIEAARPDYAAEARACATVDDARAVWRRARNAGHVQADGKDPLSVELIQIADDIAKGIDTRTGEVPGDEPGPDDDGVFDAEVIDEDDGSEPPAAVWPETAAPGSGATR
jgi:hypothetical protein